MKLGETLAAISDDQSVKVSVSNCGVVVTVLGHSWVFVVPRAGSALVLACHGAAEGLEGHTLAPDLTDPADCPGCRDLFQTVKPAPPSAGSASKPKPARPAIGGATGRKQ